MGNRSAQDEVCRACARVDGFKGLLPVSLPMKTSCSLVYSCLAWEAGSSIWLYRLWQSEVLTILAAMQARAAVRALLLLASLAAEFNKD